MLIPGRLPVNEKSIAKTADRIHVATPAFPERTAPLSVQVLIRVANINSAYFGRPLNTECW